MKFNAAYSQAAFMLNSLSIELKSVGTGIEYGIIFMIHMHMHQFTYVIYTENM